MTDDQGNVVPIRPEPFEPGRDETHKAVRADHEPGETAAQRCIVCVVRALDAENGTNATAGAPATGNGIPVPVRLEGRVGPGGASAIVLVDSAGRPLCAMSKRMAKDLGRQLQKAAGQLGR